MDFVRNVYVGMACGGAGCDPVDEHSPRVCYNTLNGAGIEHTDSVY